MKVFLVMVETTYKEDAEKITPEFISSLIRHETPTEDAYVKEIK